MSKKGKSKETFKDGEYFINYYNIIPTDIAVLDSMLEPLAPVPAYVTPTEYYLTICKYLCFEEQ